MNVVKLLFFILVIVKHCDVTDSICPPEWKYFEDNCYLFPTEKVSWDEANANCNEYTGSQLIRVHSNQETKFILDNLLGNSWIGLHFVDNRNQWFWNNETTALQFKNWVPGEPNDPGLCSVIYNENDECKNGKWFKVHCRNYYKFPYICKVKKDVCLEEWISFNSHCYFFSGDSKYWEEAENKCISLEAQLVSIQSEDENKFITDRVRWHTLIGLYSINPHNNWEWSDRTELNYSNWFNETPTELFPEKCGMMYKEYPKYNGMWNNELCTSKLNYVCQKHTGVVCPELNLTSSSYSGLKIKCTNTAGTTVSCTEPMKSGTIVTFECNEFYKRLPNKSKSILRCSSAGEWIGSRDANICKPICGVRYSSSHFQESRGLSVQRWPWNAELYIRKSKYDTWRYICSGTLISDKIILTAASCVTKYRSRDVLSETELKVQLGKINGIFDTTDTNSQRVDVQKITIHRRYSPTTLESDIAIVFLKSSVTINTYVRPVCYPNNGNAMLENIQLTPNKFGMSLGWKKAMDTRSTFEPVEINLTVLSTNICLDKLHASPRKFFRLTTFCAELSNETSEVCASKRGSGMVFKSITDSGEIWTLQGIASTDFSYEASACTRDMFLTRVGRYADWIQNEIENVQNLKN